MGDDQAFQIALGNIDTTTGQRIGEFDPRTIQQSKCQIKIQTTHIWNKSYDVQLDTTASGVNQATTDQKKGHAWKDELVIKKANCKRKREVIENMDFKSDKELACMYDDNAPNEKKFRVEEVRPMDQKADDSSTSIVITAPKSPLKDRGRENKSASFKRNTFAVQTLPSRSKLDMNKPRNKVCSRYFPCNGKIQEQGSIKNHRPERCSDSQTLNGEHFESCLPAGSGQTDNVVAHYTAESHVSSTNISVSVFNWSKISGTNLCGKREECLLSGAWQKEDFHIVKANEDLCENAKTLTSTSLLNRPEPCTPTPRNAQRLSANKVTPSSDKRCTGELQPMDLSVNGDFKLAMKDQFINWYADKVSENLIESKKDTGVDLRISVMKPLHARWMEAAISKFKRTVEYQAC
ncbi:uncharacterized protein LOC124256198 isoform X2 [Haliotis rubra]|uniref:uncharacterized protein LOC124256198 isoform X2 n=1 Tax=Haliotis rubra TaxID=36100 RepID=UPI001EE5C7AE|nr:uncharacterized protein LOC124256198 isoform X2 [Haliotis rubra]